MQFRRMMGVAAIALTLITAGCASDEGTKDTTTPPAETQTAAPAEGMGTHSTTASDAPATGSDAGHTHSDGTTHTGGH